MKVYVALCVACKHCGSTARVIVRSRRVTTEELKTIKSGLGFCSTSRDVIVELDGDPALFDMREE